MTAQRVRVAAQHRSVRVAAQHRLVPLVLLAVITPLLGALIAVTSPLHYRATSAVLISSNHIASLDDLGAGSQLAVNIAPSFVPVVTSAGVLSPVIAKLQLATSADALAKDIRVTLPLNGTVLTISGTAHSREVAAQLVNAVADQFTQLVPKLAPTLDSAPAFVATKIEPAYPPASYIGLRVVAGLVVGLLLALAIGWAVVASYEANPAIDTFAAARRAIAAPVVGVIPWITADFRPVGDEADPEAEPYRLMRTTLRLVAPHRHVLLMASARPGDGRTTVAINLALSATRAARSVLLLEADCANPQVARTLDLADGPGLMEILDGSATVADAVQHYGDRGLHVITVGDRPHAGPLGAPAMTTFIEQARDGYDLVIIDAPALAASSAALALAAHVDGVIVVVNAVNTRQRVVAATIDSLTVAGGSMAGIVVNRAVPPTSEHFTLGADHTLDELAGV